jgi:hypothetical protein
VNEIESKGNIFVKEGTVLANSGPLHMTILCKKRGRFLNEEAKEGARYTLRVLRQLSDFLPTIKQ